MSIESVMPSNQLILCHSLLLLSDFSSIKVFSNKLVLCIRWPKFWRFSFSTNPSKIQGWFPLGFTGLISLLSKGLSRVFSSTTVQKQFFGAHSSLLHLLHQTLVYMISPTLVYYYLDYSRVFPLFVTSTPMVRNISTIHHPYIKLFISSVQVR